MKFKYIFDRVVSFIGLLFLWPVLLIVAILIKVKMPGGPVLFVQKRVGKDGRLFDCHKFRTMVNNVNVNLNENENDDEFRALKARLCSKESKNDNDNLNPNDKAAIEREQSQTDLSSAKREQARPQVNENQKGGWSTVSVAGDSRITPLGATLRHYKLDELPGLWDVLIGNMSFVGPRPDVPGYADKLVGDDRDVLKLRPGITGPATLKYRLEDEYLANARELVANLNLNPDVNLEGMTDQELAVWYNDNVIYPDKVRLNCYYYRHYSFVKDIQMIFCTVLGKKMQYAGEEI